jgi:hypothetical protein
MAALNNRLNDPNKINEMLYEIEQKINNLLKLGNKITAKQQILLDDLNRRYIEIKEKQLTTRRSRSRSRTRSKSSKANERRHNGPNLTRHTGPNLTRHTGRRHNGPNVTRHNGQRHTGPKEPTHTGHTPFAALNSLPPPPRYKSKSPNKKKYNGR